MRTSHNLSKTCSVFSFKKNYMRQENLQALMSTHDALPSCSYVKMSHFVSFEAAVFRQTY